ncbi:MAG: DivIVA domain-containing protein [Actinobacteria bacterium]|nr:DivIVA domain-containing protein [Actinomycetota bacterium]
MIINSENIQKKEFHIVFKGYKPEEVYKFLDSLSIEFEKLRKRLKELEEGIDSMKYEGDKESVQMKKVIQEALVSAHKVAEEIKQKARKEAEELVNSKKMEEERAIRKIQTEKEMLEKSLAGLKEDYKSFKLQISKFADDFKQKTLNIGDIQLSDTFKKIELASEKISSNTLDSYGEKEEINKYGNMEDSSFSEYTENTKNLSEDQTEYKHAKKESIEEAGDSEDERKDLSTIADDIIEKMDYQGTGGLKEERNNIEKGSYGSSDMEEDDAADEEDKEETEKKIRKKIDIANPDIINDFFKTDED